MSGNIHTCTETSSQNYTHTDRQHYSSSIPQKGNRTNTPLSKNSRGNTTTTATKTTTTGTNTQTRNTNVFTRQTLQKHTQCMRLGTRSTSIHGLKDTIPPTSSMGRICKPTYTQTKQIPHLGTTPRSPTLGCTTHRLDTTNGHHLRISTIPPINTNIEEDTSTQEENNTDPSNMANSHMAQQLLQSSSHNSPEQTTIHTNTTETHMETQETTHTENTIPTKKLAVRFNEFLQQHRPTFATDNQQWDKVCQELIQRKYHTKWQTYNTVITTNNIPIIPTWTTEQNTQWTNYISHLSTSKTNHMRQIRSTLIPMLTEEQKYFNLLQEIIQQEKPGSDIFTVQGDGFDILKTTINIC